MEHCAQLPAPTALPILKYSPQRVLIRGSLFALRTLLNAGNIYTSVKLKLTSFEKCYFLRISETSIIRCVGHEKLKSAAFEFDAVWLYSVITKTHLLVSLEVRQVSNFGQIECRTCPLTGEVC